PEIHPLSLHDALPIYGALHGVTGQPWVGAQGEAAGEQDAVGVGQRYGRREERMAHVVESETGGPSRGAGLQPVAAVLEGVGGQRSEEHTSELQSRSEL